MSRGGRNRWKQQQEIQVVDPLPSYSPSSLSLSLSLSPLSFPPSFTLPLPPSRPRVVGFDPLIQTYNTRILPQMSSPAPLSLSPLSIRHCYNGPRRNESMRGAGGDSGCCWRRMINVGKFLTLSSLSLPSPFQLLPLSRPPLPAAAIQRLE